MLGAVMPSVFALNSKLQQKDLKDVAKTFGFYISGFFFFFFFLQHQLFSIFTPFVGFFPKNLSTFQKQFYEKPFLTFC
jgi:hypothetical protein